MAQTPTFDPHRSFQYLETQCSFGPRSPGSAGYYSCLEWLTETLHQLSDELYQQRFEAVNPLSGERYMLTNIIARIEGEADYPLMLCAHWDTRPWADYEQEGEDRLKPILGANDGASGVAVLLEIARICREAVPPRTVIIVLFDGEDMGRQGHSEEYALGSKHWAGHPLPEKPVEAILLDMVGDADLEIPIEPFSERGAPNLRRRLWSLAERLDLPAFVDRYGAAVEDDHVSLLKVGIPAVDLIDFEYPYWHTLQDTPDKCSPESLEQVGRLLVQFIYGAE